MGGPAAIGGISANVMQTSFVNNDTDDSALELLKHMMQMLEDSGVELPAGISSDMLDNQQGFLQELIDDLDPASIAQFQAAMAGVDIENLDPAQTAELISAIGNGALEPGSPDYIQTERQVQEVLDTYRNNFGANTQARNAAESLPDNSITRQLVDPLFAAADAQESKVEGMLAILDGYNARVKQGQTAMHSGDTQQMKDYLVEHNPEVTYESLAGKSEADLKEMIRDDIENVGQLSETHQIRLQQAMAHLQIIYSTAAGVVDAIAQATKGAASRIGN